MKKLSRCCGAEFQGVVSNGLGICSDCKEWSGVEEKKQIAMQKEEVKKVDTNIEDWKEEVCLRFAEVAFMAMGMIFERNVPNETVKEFNKRTVEIRDKAIKDTEKFIQSLLEQEREKVLKEVLKKMYDSNDSTEQIILSKLK